MKSMKRLLIGIGVAVVSTVCVAQEAFPDRLAQPAPDAVLEGDEADACSMLLCLSDPSGKGLAECEGPLRKFSELEPGKGPDFLSKCPVVSDDK